MYDDVMCMQVDPPSLKYKLTWVYKYKKYSIHIQHLVNKYYKYYT